MTAPENAMSSLYTYSYRQSLYIIIKPVYQNGSIWFKVYRNESGILQFT